MVVLLLPHGCSLMHLHNVAHRILTSFRPNYIMQMGFEFIWELHFPKYYKPTF